MNGNPNDSPAALGGTIERYNAAWNAHDLEAIVSMHAPDMVFANHTAGEAAAGADVRAHIAKIFTTWPDLGFEIRRLYVREGLVVQEWDATATHTRTMVRGSVVVRPTGRRIRWEGIDSIPFADGLVKRKDVYSDGVSILRQLGVLE